ncbi:MAG: carbohydrate-binding protein, partial [Clostridium sp.]
TAGGEVNPPLTDNWDAAHGYTMGDIVIYGGKKYESQGWWVVGIVPGTNSTVWKPIV